MSDSPPAAGALYTGVKILKNMKTTSLKESNYNSF